MIQFSLQGMCTLANHIESALEVPTLLGSIPGSAILVPK